MSEKLVVRFSSFFGGESLSVSVSLFFSFSFAGKARERGGDSAIGTYGRRWGCGLRRTRGRSNYTQKQPTVSINHHNNNHHPSTSTITEHTLSFGIGAVPCLDDVLFFLFFFFFSAEHAHVRRNEKSCLKEGMDYGWLACQM